MNFYMLVIPLVSIALEWQLAAGDSDKCQLLKPLYDIFECRTCKGGNSNYYKCSKFFKNYSKDKCYFNNTQYAAGESVPGTYPSRDGSESCTYDCVVTSDSSHFGPSDCNPPKPVVNPNECFYERLANQDLFFIYGAPVYPPVNGCPTGWMSTPPTGLNGTCTGNPDMCCKYLGDLMPVGQTFQVNGIACFCNCPPLAECISP